MGRSYGLRFITYGVYKCLIGKSVLVDTKVIGLLTQNIVIVCMRTNFTAILQLFPYYFGVSFYKAAYFIKRCNYTIGS